jgi:hypothetical protein
MYQVNNKINKILLFLGSLLLIGIFFPLYKFKGISNSFINGQYNESNVESSSVLFISTWVGVLSLLMIGFILYSLYKHKTENMYHYLTILFFILVPIILFFYCIYLNSSGKYHDSIGNNGNSISVHRNVIVNEITFLYYLILSIVGLILSFFRRIKKTQ